MCFNFIIKPFYNFIVNLWERYPVYIYAVKNYSKDYPEEDYPYCGICMIDYSITEYSTKYLGHNLYRNNLYAVLEYCNHTFHKDCIDKWIRQCEEIRKTPSCPYCRKIIRKYSTTTIIDLEAMGTLLVDD